MRRTVQPSRLKTLHQGAGQPRQEQSIRLLIKHHRIKTKL